MVNAFSVNCTDQKSSEEALEKAKKVTGLVPEFVFTCAGVSKPGFFLEQDIQDFKNGMDLNYFGTLNTIKVNYLFII